MNGLARGAHRKTSGITHLSDEQSKYSVLDQSFTKSIARAEAGGKATNQQEKDAKEAYSTGFRDAREQRNAIAGGLEKIVRSLEKNMQNLEQKAEIRQETHNMHLMLKDYRDYLGSANYNDRRAQEMFNYIEKSEYGKNFNYDEWAKVRPKQNYSY